MTLQAAAGLVISAGTRRSPVAFRAEGLHKALIRHGCGRLQRVQVRAGRCNLEWIRSPKASHPTPNPVQWFADDAVNSRNLANPACLRKALRTLLVHTERTSLFCFRTTTVVVLLLKRHAIHSDVPPIVVIRNLPALIRHGCAAEGASGSLALQPLRADGVDSKSQSTTRHPCPPTWFQELQASMGQSSFASSSALQAATTSAFKWASTSRFR